MRRSLIFIIMFSLVMSPVGAVGFTLGGKEVWSEICQGRFESYTTEASQSICHTALMLYWAGYTHAQYQAGLDITLCPATLDESIVGSFTEFLSGSNHGDEVDFIVLANDFFVEQGPCG